MWWDNTYMNLGEKVKKRRLELNLTQEELAKKMGYSSQSLGNFLMEWLFLKVQMTNMTLYQLMLQTSVPGLLGNMLAWFA